MPKYRKMLSDLTIPPIAAMMELLPTQSKATIANWTIDYAEGVILPVWLKHYPNDPRPLQALTAARDWLAGKVKLPVVKKIILDECHAAARENDANPAAQAAARAIGQAASTIHAPTHSIGIAFYGALAIAYDKLGQDAPWPELEACAIEECGRMLEALRAVSVENEPNPAKINWRC